MHKKIISTIALGLIIGASTISANANPKLSDVNGHWANKEIQQFISNGFINGYEDGTFKPDNSITRAEFVKIANKYFGFTAKGSENFSDVNPGDWFYNDICIAQKEGYINGYEDGTFKPDKTITREEAAKIIISIKNREDTKIDKLNNFADGHIVSDWAKKYVEGAIECGYIKGDDKGKINPLSNITRAESVSMLSRVNKNDSDIQDNNPKLTVNKHEFEIVVGEHWDNSMIGAKAISNKFGDISDRIQYRGDVDTSKPGKYFIDLEVVNPGGGLVVSDRVCVIVRESAYDPNKGDMPCLTVFKERLSLVVGDYFNYGQFMARAIDKEDGDITNKINYEGKVDISKAGEYKVIVSVVDSDGNKVSKECSVLVSKDRLKYNPNSSEFKSAVTSQMLTLVNQHRVANGKVALSSNGRLSTSANAWSKYMADNSFFDHTDGSGNGVEQVFPQYAPVSGENIALTQLKTTGDMQQDAINLANELFYMWKNSSAHNATMLRGYYRIFGLGIHAVDLGDGVYTMYATQHFGTGSTEPGALVR